MSFVRKLTPERERNMRRGHARLHPDGLYSTGRVCEVCLLLAALKDARAANPTPAEDGGSHRKETDPSSALSP